ncbi:MAG: S24/S26 family peptidase [Clostridia bacterium]|nr:S24/S26 family peptidase [Clostridia bacterium]
MKNSKRVSLEELFPVMLEQLESGKKITFRPRGTSMLPLLREGKDGIVLEKSKGNHRKNDIVFYRRKNGQFVLHRIVYTKDGYVISGDHQLFFEYGITDDEIIGVATGFYRGEKYYSVNNIFYRIYVFLIRIRRNFKNSIFGRITARIFH